MLIEEYFLQLEAWIAQTPYLANVSLIKEKRSSYIGFIKGTIEFTDRSTLSVMEFVDVERGMDRYKYRYHYEDQNKQRVFRYDRAPHFPSVLTHPHHKHIGPETDPDRVTESSAPPLNEVLKEIERMLTP